MLLLILFWLAVEAEIFYSYAYIDVCHGSSIFNCFNIITCLQLFTFFSTDELNKPHKYFTKLLEEIELIIKIAFCTNLALLKCNVMFIILVVSLIAWINAINHSFGQHILPWCKWPIEIWVIRMSEIFLLIIDNKIDLIVY